MATRLSALRAGRFWSPGRFLVLISVRGWVDLRTIVRLERLGQLKKSGRKRTLWIRRRIWVDNIKMSLKNIRIKIMELIHVVQDRQLLHHTFQNMKVITSYYLRFEMDVCSSHLPTGCFDASRSILVTRFTVLSNFRVEIQIKSLGLGAALSVNIYQNECINNNWKVLSSDISGSSPDVIEFFNWSNSSSRTMALGSTQPLKQMTTTDHWVIQCYAIECNRSFYYALFCIFMTRVSQCSISLRTEHPIYFCISLAFTSELQIPCFPGLTWRNLDLSGYLGHLLRHDLP
jgi:hypothetical protein